MPVSIVQIDSFEYGVGGDSVGVLSVLELRVGPNLHAKLLPFQFVLHPEQKRILIRPTRPDSGHDGKLLRESIFREFRENIS